MINSGSRTLYSVTLPNLSRLTLQNSKSATSFTFGIGSFPGIVIGMSSYISLLFSVDEYCSSAGKTCVFRSAIVAVTGALRKTVKRCVFARIWNTEGVTFFWTINIQFISAKPKRKQVQGKDKPSRYEWMIGVGKEKVNRPSSWLLFHVCVVISRSLAGHCSI